MGIFSCIASIFKRKHLDDAALTAVQDALVSADIAPDIADDITSRLRARFRPTDDTDDAEIKSALRDILCPYVEKLQPGADSGALMTDSAKKPLVILVIGVNGAGKTTSIGKMAAKMTHDGKKVVIGACDTFRAAAAGQLSEWATRAGAVLIPEDQNKCSADPASVAYQAIEHGINTGADVVILDTAGRLHNRTDLMDELSKMTRVIKKLDGAAPHETYLVLDSTVGQNATAQIEYFDKVAPLSGIVVTKMDSTSKGGFLITYAAKNKSPLPVVGIGYGEALSDLRAFDAGEYLGKLLDI